MNFSPKLDFLPETIPPPNSVRAIRAARMRKHLPSCSVRDPDAEDQIRLSVIHYPKKPQNVPHERILSPRRPPSWGVGSTDTPLVDGRCITLEQATMTREILFGVSPSSRMDGLKAGFTFRALEKLFAYGLNCNKSATRGFVMCLQSYVLKNLLFARDGTSLSQLPSDSAIKPTKTRQVEALVYALSEILWKAGEQKNVTICLPDAEVCIPKEKWTEKLRLFDFNNFESVVQFMKYHFQAFHDENGYGSLLLLYALILTRGHERISQDLNGEQDHLLTPNGDCSLALINLLLIGKATPYLHDGIVYTGQRYSSGNVLQVGITCRNDIGLLVWTSNEKMRKQNQVGSRLKTPSLPIWVTCIDGQYGVLFNTNYDLLRDYKAERRFDLHYYSSSHYQTEPTILTVDTRTPRPVDETRVRPALERLILMKWQGAKVEWNGSVPFF